MTVKQILTLETVFVSKNKLFWSVPFVSDKTRVKYLKRLERNTYKDIRT